ncbi:MAG: hydroxymethylglutaryl-CoA reductase, degradative [Candidatus Thermoplasmatota archaeon]|nr:hydroxymethylglutaryl-CoA reductase, degradative [Candidatus Thermoplasmatota archaeon]
MGSDITGFYKMSIEERKRKVAEEIGLDISELKGLDIEGTDLSLLDGMIENVVGTFQLPLGIATNFMIDGRDHLVPMALEEPSVVAAASKAAKIARVSGGFRTTTTEPVMIGQIQITDIPDPEASKRMIDERKSELLELANSKDPLLVKIGGGARDIEIRVLDSSMGKMVIVHVLVDCRDAMGANAVNTMVEALAPELESITGGSVVLRIISNLAIHRLATAKAVFPKDEIGGDEGVNLILKAYELAVVDPFRASTHNKGIMNGVSAVVRATGNDTRAVEAGAHSYAAYKGIYSPLTKYYKNEDGDLVGGITIPTAVGLVGGATKVHPAAKAAVKILGVTSARELGSVLASVGLAQNFAALRVLAVEGIQKGHMKLHARNLALQAGAGPEEVDIVVAEMIRSGKVTGSGAEEALSRVKK